MFVDDGILVWVAVDGGGVRRGGKEVGEELGFVKARKREDREDGSGQGWGGDGSNRCGDGGQWEVLYRDISKWDMLNDFLELAMGILVLVLGL
jgi:hypothetical protein